MFNNIFVNAGLVVAGTAIAAVGIFGFFSDDEKPAVAITSETPATPEQPADAVSETVS